MLQRHAISDADWNRIKDLLPGRPGQTGWLAEDNRRFVDAVLYIARTGIPWRDLPARFGNWNSVWRRFDRWCHKGTWQRVFEVLQDPDLEGLILDSTVVRAHLSAAGAKKKRTAPADKTSKLLAAAVAGSEPRSMSLPTGWDCQ